jgi:hypothetical protein
MPPTGAMRYPFSSGPDSLSDVIEGILVLYYHPLGPFAPTVMDHAGAFGRHSQFKVWSINTAYGFPKALTSFEFRTIVLHYSLFGMVPYELSYYFQRYLASTGAYKVAFFQDEYHYWKPRFEFLNRYRVDCVHTLLEPQYWDSVYLRYTSVPKLVYGIPGYVADDLVALADQITIPDDEREIDVGYRGRTLPPYMGRGAREKAEIGLQFAERARAYDLKLDIAVDEASRIYGDDWFRFLANCRGVLGVEAGVSVFDIDDSVREAYDRLVAADPDVTFEEIEARILAPKEDTIFYRTVSPRHFEAAALRVCQIMFEGSYSGVLEPMIHYIPLRKDFSNLDEVVQRFRDHELRRTLTENAYSTLIASGLYSYRRFVEEFDAGLLAEGFSPELDPELAQQVTAALGRNLEWIERGVRLDAALRRQFPGRQALKRVLKPVLRLVRAGRSWYRRRRYQRWQRRFVDGQ